MERLGSLVRKLLRLAWPVALARLGIMGMSVVDVMVVGQLAPTELGWQALGWAPVHVLTVSGIGLLYGVQVLAARAVGASDRARAGGAWRRGVLLAAASGMLAMGLVWLTSGHLFAAFGIEPGLATNSARVSQILALSVPPYLLYVASSFFFEAIQRPLVSTLAMWGANVVNLILNLWLVPKWGAVGSAWCTVGARVFLALVLMALIWRLPESEGWSVRQKARSAPTWRELLGVGAATLLSNAVESGAFSGMTIIAGRLGERAVASYQIVLNLLSVIFMLSLGISSATGVLTAEAVGRRALPDARRATQVGLALNAGVMALIGIALLLFAPQISRAYTRDAALAAAVTGTLWLATLIVVPDGGQVVAAAALRARGDNWFPTLSHFLSYAAIMPPLAYYLAEIRARGVTGLMLAILAASIVSYAILVARQRTLQT
jgi:MATE family multidrug resistance protein